MKPIKSWIYFKFMNIASIRVDAMSMLLGSLSRKVKEVNNVLPSLSDLIKYHLPAVLTLTE